jgi:hypothetical protein
MMSVIDFLDARILIVGDQEATHADDVAKMALKVMQVELT